jgi:hypothetical protein
MVCKPASLMLMYAGAGVLLGGEVITYFSHKKKLKNMKDRWKEIATPKSDASGDSKRVQQTEAQSQAFEFLAQNEDSIARLLIRNLSIMPLLQDCLQPVR